MARRRRSRSPAVASAAPGEATWRRKVGRAEAAAVRLSLLGLALLLWCDPQCPAVSSMWARGVSAALGQLAGAAAASTAAGAAGAEAPSTAGDGSDGGDIGASTGTPEQRLLFALGLSALLCATFWLVNGALLLAARCGALERYRIAVPQPAPAPGLLRECVQDALLGQLVVRPLLIYGAFPLFVGFASMRMDAASLPSCRSLLLQFLGCMLLDDFLFYWTHRALHHYPLLYKHIHKQHHKFGHTVGLAVEYAHPVEDLLNAASTMAGPVLFGSHMALVWLYPTIKLTQSIDAHSGYDLPFPLSIWSAVDAMDCAPAHSFHHSRNTGMYGGYFVFWDRMMGTDASYKAYLARGKGGGGSTRKVS